MTNYNKWTKIELVDEINRLKLSEQVVGSGKNKSALRKDLILTLTSQKSVNVDLLSNMPEDMIRKVAYHLPPVSVLEYCKTSNKFNKICSKEYFWVKKYKEDFGNFNKYIIPVTIRQAYIFKAKQNIELMILLNDLTNFNELNFESQKKYYALAVSHFRQVNIHPVGDNDIAEELARVMMKIKFGNLSNYVGDGVIEDIYDDDELIQKILDAYNSIMDTNIDFENIYN